MSSRGLWTPPAVSTGRDLSRTPYAGLAETGAPKSGSGLWAVKSHTGSRSQSTVGSRNPGREARALGAGRTVCGPACSHRSGVGDSASSRSHYSGIRSGVSGPPRSMQLRPETTLPPAMIGPDEWRAGFCV